MPSLTAAATTGMYSANVGTGARAAGGMRRSCAVRPIRARTRRAASRSAARGAGSTAVTSARRLRVGRGSRQVARQARWAGRGPERPRPACRPTGPGRRAAARGSAGRSRATGDDRGWSRRCPHRCRRRRRRVLPIREPRWGCQAARPSPRSTACSASRPRESIVAIPDQDTADPGWAKHRPRKSSTRYRLGRAPGSPGRSGDPGRDGADGHRVHPRSAASSQPFGCRPCWRGCKHRYVR